MKSIFCGKNLGSLLFFAFLQSVFCQSVTTDTVFLKRINDTFLKLNNQLEVAKKVNDEKALVNSHLKLGDFYKSIEVFNEVIYHYHEALLQKEGTDTVTIRIYQNLGTVYFMQEQFVKAEMHFTEAYEASREITFLPGQATAYGAIGSCFEKVEKYQEALKFQQKSLNIFTHLKDSTGIALAFENLGSIYEDLAQYDEAYLYFKKALNYIIHSPDTNRYINILNNLGDVNRKRGNFEKAFLYTSQAQELAIKTDNRHQLQSVLKDLAKTYRLQGDHENAYSMLEASNSVRDEIRSFKNIRQLNTLQVLYGAKEKKAQIALLTKQNEVTRANQTLLAGGIFVTAAIMALLFYGYKKRKQQETRIQQYKQQALKADLEKKILKEENLQREIHIKTTALSNYSLHLAHKNKILHGVMQKLTHLKDRKNMNMRACLESLASEIKEGLSEKNDWLEVIRFFEQIHPNFFKNLNTRACATLSPTEVRLCMLLRLSLSSREIASVLHVTPDSVRIARYRLRKKLPLEKGEELTRFIFTL